MLSLNIFCIHRHSIALECGHVIMWIIIFVDNEVYNECMLRFFCLFFVEPYDVMSWIFILLVCINVVTACLFILEWLSPNGLNASLQQPSGILLIHLFVLNHVLYLVCMRYTFFCSVSCLYVLRFLSCLYVL